MPRQKYYNRWYSSDVSCCHKRHCCCEEKDDEEPPTCTVINPSLFTHRTYVKGFDGNNDVLVLNSAQNVFNITDIANTSSTLSLYLQRDVATGTLLYGSIIAFTTAGVPGIYDQQVQGSQVTTEGYYPTGLPPLNGGPEKADTIKLILNRPTSTNLWPPTFSITFDFIYEEYGKPQCTISHPVTYFIVNENEITTRSGLKADGVNLAGDVPTGTLLPYNLTYNVIIKAATFSTPLITWESNPSSGVNIQTTFVQDIVDPKFTPDFQLTSANIPFSGIESEDETFVLTEIARFDDGSLIGTKTFNVTVQPPVPTRTQYWPLPGMPNTLSIANTNGEGSYVSYKSTHTGYRPLHLRQDPDLSMNPVIWIPFQWTHGSGTNMIPRFQVSDEMLTQSSYNTPSTVTGVAVSPSGATWPLMWLNVNQSGFVAGSISLNTGIANLRAWLDANYGSGKSMMGFKFTNIPVYNGNRDSGLSLRLSNVFTNINTLSSTMTFSTAQSLFSSNDSGKVVADLFLGNTNGDYEAGSLKLKNAGDGITVLRIPKSALFKDSLMLFYQGPINIVASDGTTFTPLWGTKRGKLDFTIARLDQYPLYNEDATHYYYAFRRIDGEEGYVRGIGWYLITS